ncbi:polysaccharide biosynthesis protein [Clostridium vincentii]|nr:nucleoside-diphosphate sugar epimerase/dehydratase [Clostridium vincentii]
MDSFLIHVAYFLALCFRFKFINVNMKEIINSYSENFLRICGIVLIYIFLFAIYKQYRSIWTIASIEEFSLGVLATISALFIVVVLSLLDENRIPIMVTVMAGVIIILECNGMRIGLRIVKRIFSYLKIERDVDVKRVLVVGAGSAGSMVINECKKNSKWKKKIIVLVDDNKEKLGTFVAGIKVEGNREMIPELVKTKNIQEIIITISLLKEKDLKEIIYYCKKTSAQIKIMPGVSEIIDGKFNLSKIRDVDVEDLLGREPIELDLDGIADYIEDKVILVTGGGGSIGSELCRQIVKFNPRELIILDIYENNAYNIQNELLEYKEDLNLKTLIGSVRDRERLRYIYSKYKPQVIFHAAAHKHVPLMEENPTEAIKNNVIGTLNVAEFASEFKVEKFILISTDKAVNPTNIMGATKRICEMIIQAIDEESETEFVAVRFGNVLGSNGSVVPLFKRQIAKGGPITLTHMDITRYFMTIPEASQLVLQAVDYAKGGEIFVLDMGSPVKIYDLAENLIRLSGYEPGKDIKLNIIGLRPGEKLYEELLMKEEGLINTEHERIFIEKLSTVSFKVLKGQINELMDTVIVGNEDMLRVKLKELVPGYKRGNN